MSNRSPQSSIDADVNNDIETTAWLIHRLALALDAVEVRVAQHLRLSPLEFLAVKHVLLSDRPLGPGELAHRLGVSSGSATELVDRLHRAGHVLRVPDATDGRRRVVLMTAEGERRVRHAMRSASVGITVGAAGAKAADNQALQKLLSDVCCELEQWATGADNIANHIEEGIS